MSTVNPLTALIKAVGDAVDTNEAATDAAATEAVTQIKALADQVQAAMGAGKNAAAAKLCESLEELADALGAHILLGTSPDEGGKMPADHQAEPPKVDEPAAAVAKAGEALAKAAGAPWSLASSNALRKALAGLQASVAKAGETIDLGALIAPVQKAMTSAAQLAGREHRWPMRISAAASRR